LDISHKKHKITKIHFDLHVLYVSILKDIKLFCFFVFFVAVLNFKIFQATQSNRTPGAIMEIFPLDGSPAFW